MTQLQKRSWFMVARGQREGGGRRELSVAGRASKRTPALEEMFYMLAIWVVTLCSARCQPWRKLSKCYKRWFCILTVACASMITSKYKKFKVFLGIHICFLDYVFFYTVPIVSFAWFAFFYLLLQCLCVAVMPFLVLILLVCPGLLFALLEHKWNFP